MAEVSKSKRKAAQAENKPIMAKLTLKEIFLECQRPVQTHGKLVKELIKLYKATEFGKFWNEFVYYLKCALLVFEREPAVERCLEFVAKFATSLKDDGEKKEKSEEVEPDQIDEDIHQFLLKLFDFCLEHHDANDRAVRFRVCQLVNKLLNKMGEDAQIDDELYDRIFECMLIRLRDLFPIIRIQAVFALARLQDPTDTDCPIINGYLFLLSCDTNSDVRRAVLTCIAASTKTLPALLERTRDVKSTVRRLAYQILAEKVHIRALTIAQRLQVLENGLRDRDESVRESCTVRLLQAWLGTFKGNTLDLLKCLDVENSLKTAQLVLTNLFKKTPAHELVTNFDILNKEDLVIDLENLSCESVLFWRSLCEHLAGLGLPGEELLEKVLPLPKAFGNYLSKVVTSMRAEQDLDAQLTNEFILHQLLELAKQLDLSDEAGRKIIGLLMHDLMVSGLTSHTVMPTLVARYAQFQKDPVARINALCETIAEIREPITLVENERSADENRQIEIKLAKVRVQLNQLREDLEESVNKQDFEKAADIKAKVVVLQEERQALLDESQPSTQEVRTEKTDSATLLKCMSIASSMLAEVHFQQVPVSLQTLIETLMLPGIQNEDPAVRNLAVKALGLCCLMKSDIAKKHMMLFITVSQLDFDTVKVTALQVIFDLLLTFGLETFDAGGTSAEEAEQEKPETDDKSDDEVDEDAEMEDEEAPVKPKEKGNKRSQSLIYILTDLLSSKVSEVRTVAAQGLAKLLLAGRIMAPKLISRLLLLWYNPLTEDDTLLRHCLGTFFPIYAFASVSNQALVEEAILPTLRTLFNAPTSSPLAEVDVNNVSDLLVQLTNAHHLLSTKWADLETTSHDTLAMKLCNEILSELQSEDSCSIRPLIRVLGALELSPNYSGLKDLAVLAEEIAGKIKDKPTQKSLQKFQDAVQIRLKKAGIVEEVIEVTEPEVVGSDAAEVVGSEVADVGGSEVDPLRTSEVSHGSPTSHAEPDGTESMSTESPSTVTCTTANVHNTPGPKPTEKETSSSPNSRTALGPVQDNAARTNSPQQQEADSVFLDESSSKRATRSTRTPAKGTKRKDRKPSGNPPENSNSELENEVQVSTPVRRSTRSRRGKADVTETSAQDETIGQSETDSPMRPTRTTRAKRTKRT